MTSEGSSESDVNQLNSWLAEVSTSAWIWHVKYLSANDTYAKPNVHQAGPYLSKSLLSAAFPNFTVRSSQERNPDIVLHAAIDSHGWSGDVRGVWYNSKRLEKRANGRDEARITGWNGKQNPLVEPNATGSLVVFAFNCERGDAETIRIWIARSEVETDRILDTVGDVEPGGGVVLSPAGAVYIGRRHATTCALTAADIPTPWLARFPSGDEIVQWVLTNRDAWRKSDPDRRLLRRRSCEYEVFQSIEGEHVLPRIRQGFSDVDTFIDYSNAVANRRKARAGRSLELHLRAIFDEEGVAYSWTPKTEGNRRPDFIFPSIDLYRDGAHPSSKLFMLAAKTTCKDRWRQILNEAERVPVKHLFTLQEGISLDQHAEMADEKVQLVVPAELVKAYPEAIRDSLVTLEGFINLVNR